MRILASCPPAYDAPTCGADVPETYHPTADAGRVGLPCHARRLARRRAAPAVSVRRAWRPVADPG
jgi:hypothetical protein